MTELKELFTKKPVSVTSDGSLQFGRDIILRGEITDIAFFPDLSLKLSKKDNGKEHYGAFIGISTSSPHRQAGKFPPTSSYFMFMRFGDPERAEDLYYELEDFVSPQLSVLHPFPADRCYGEVKKGPSNYVRMANPGYNPYGKYGLVYPMIDYKVNIAEHCVDTHFVGTNSRMDTSEYFRANPDNRFDYFDVTDIKYLITWKTGSNLIASASYKRMDIERSDDGKGIWHLCLEKDFRDGCEAIRWLRALRNGPVEINYALTDETGNSSAEDPGADAPEKLLQQLDNLHNAGIITDDEWHAKRKEFE
ncbi:MAG: hypothetical protein K5637_07505 [Lachnospiraceae bacterium]|nr:hypothetical protein [Lachnospiraceae bacterium]